MSQEQTHSRNEHLLVILAEKANSQTKHKGTYSLERLSPTSLSSRYCFQFYPSYSTLLEDMASVVHPSLRLGGESNFPSWAHLPYFWKGSLKICLRNPLPPPRSHYHAIVLKVNTQLLLYKIYQTSVRMQEFIQNRSQVRLSSKTDEGRRYSQHSRPITVIWLIYSFWTN